MGFRGAEPDMTVAQLGAYWMRRRCEEARVPVADQPRGIVQGTVSPQTLAGYQAVLSGIIIPELGGLRLTEARPGVLDEVLARVARRGRSTRVARSVLTQMFGLAVRHDALPRNPMREVQRSPRRGTDVRALTVPQARELLRQVGDHHREVARNEAGSSCGGRPRSHDLHDLLLLLLATGTRFGEALALEWTDLDLSAEIPSVRIAATLVEPRRDRSTGQVFVPTLHRQPVTKTGAQRTLALPDAAVAMLRRRRSQQYTAAGTINLRGPVFTHAGGGWLWPNNQRTKLRGILDGTPLAGTTPHTLRRTVGTLLAHTAGLDAARTQLGHRDPSVTARHYVADLTTVIDYRWVLDQLLEPPRTARGVFG